MKKFCIIFLVTTLIAFYNPCSTFAESWTAQNQIQQEPIFKGTTPKDVTKVKKSSKTWIWWVVGGIVLVGGGAALALGGGGGDDGGINNDSNTQTATG
ncbi:MAG: hypothetical protein HQK76_21070, partial [Desulfobacterales bacterium]|nr:hypothetical protein [Desulfobacterales bacterium]